MKKIFAVGAVISFFALIGTAGALDADAISLTTAIIRAAVGSISLLVCCKLAGAFEAGRD